MSQQSLHASGPEPDDDNGSTESASGGQTHASAQAADDLLDEIDSVLESNAETFVRSFVQKGGQ
ncbi:ubiquitin-like protein Pup [Brachybacterium sp. GCM10030267]|uniref:ubiquitin-like protein Pup n=1 Tax=Brachybacterium sp. GCM10030267 TaxID=3273381 RepID=UPI003619FB75